MRRTVLLAATWPVLLLAPSAPAQRELSDATMMVPRPKPRVEFIKRSYEGVVTAVTKRSITIEDLGRLPKRFSVSDLVAPDDGVPLTDLLIEAGWPHTNRILPTMSYHLADVRVGDIVGIHYTRVDGMEVCDQITIYRRPGGRVPPSFDQPSRHHEIVNEYQRAEERGERTGDLVKYRPILERLKEYAKPR
jgi:hypothetical protein